MKLSVGLLAGLIGCAAAVEPYADVFILPRPDSFSPFISKTEARLILLQRLSPFGRGPSLSDIPQDADLNVVARHLNKYGRQPTWDQAGDAARQLVIMVEGMSYYQLNEAGKILGDPAFKIDDPPSQSAHDSLAEIDLHNIGAEIETRCTITELLFSRSLKCKRDQSIVKRINCAKDVECLEQLLPQVRNLEIAASDNRIETTIVLLPFITETEYTRSWVDEETDLRRRQAEEVMTAYDAAPSSPTSAISNEDDTIFRPTAGPIASCFNSVDGCEEATRNCSGHGECLDRNAGSSQVKRADACFSCHCLSTKNTESGSVTHWAGSTCAKKDISVAFWLFAGFTLLMVLVLAMSIQALFNVGEEKLPGVIGAGVSRSK